MTAFIWDSMAPDALKKARDIKEELGTTVDHHRRGILINDLFKARLWTVSRDNYLTNKMAAHKVHARSYFYQRPYRQQLLEV